MNNPFAALDIGPPNIAPDDHPLACSCGHCNKQMRRRSLRNDPAYCTYECGMAGQPEKSGRAIFSSRGNVN